MWKIEKIVSCGDYNYAVVPGHPNAIDYDYVLEHRVVMENSLGRLLTEEEIVHHIDENKKNNILSNLELMLKSEHSRMHMLKQGRKWVKLKCPECGELFDRELRNSFLQKGSEYTCCSPRCRGLFSRFIQLNGKTPKVIKAISDNLICRYRKYSN